MLLPHLSAAAVQVVPLALLHMHPVQRCLWCLRLCPQRHLHVKVRVTRRLCVALRHRLCPQTPGNISMGGSVGPVLHRQVVSTDTSLMGWGAVHKGWGVSGTWSVPWRNQHISALELRAIYLVLRHFAPSLQGHHVLVRTDSTAAAAYINIQGGLCSPCLCRLAHKLWTWAYTQFLSLRAMPIPGQENQGADLLSRGGPSPGEWRLHPAVVGGIWGRFGRAVADLFVSRSNTHCPLFFSIGRDAPPLGTDAMAHQWPWGLLYAFPPFCLLPSLLQRVRVEEVSLILVALNWRGTTFGRGVLGTSSSPGPSEPGTGGPVSSLSAGAQALGLAPERAGLLDMGLTQSVVQTIQGV